MAMDPRTTERSARRRRAEQRLLAITNEKHEPVMVWKAHNAFPVKVEGPALKASGNEVAIESIELAHEGLEVQND